MEYGNTVAAAQARLMDREVVKGKRRARRRPRGSQLLSDYLESEWLPQVEGRVKPATFQSFESHVRLHIGPDLGDVPIEQLTREDVARFYARLVHKRATKRSHPLSTNSITRIHATLHSALENLVLANRLPNNPAKGALGRRREWAPHEFQIWTPKEVERFLLKVKVDRLFALWRVLAWTGMRRGEALGLKWADFHTETRTLAIRRALALSSGRTYVSTPKAGRSRSIALDRETIAILRRHRTAQARERRARGCKPPGSLDWIFCGVDGRELSPCRVSRRFKQLVQQTGLPDIRLHDLRHTHASHLIMAGANIKAVQERLGHTDIVVTLNVYSHLLPTTQRDAINSLSRMYSRKC